MKITFDLFFCRCLFLSCADADSVCVKVVFCRRWIADSYQFYDDLRKSGRGHDTGIFEIGGYVFSNYSPSTVRCRLMEGVVPLYRAATQDELDNFPEKWKYGAFITTLIIENRHFQPWATQRFQAAGGRVEKRTILNLSDAAKDFDVLVNCTGLGSRILCNDIKTNPIRGQVIKSGPKTLKETYVRAPWIKQFYMNDYDGYIIPNRDTITLGGCRHFGSYDLRVSAADKQTIMSKCKAMQPSLERAEFVRDWVGLRPHRDPVRVEVERMQVAGARLVPVSFKEFEHEFLVHNYGHGGYGVTSAPGTAKHAVKLLRQQLSASLGSVASKL
ncbi:hypothetical protein B566_EDAN014552 [Ephemera danica]|nr:hypothetical protein B566_EDAN014552 [Ephemera danica]